MQVAAETELSPFATTTPPSIGMDAYEIAIIIFADILAAAATAATMAVGGVDTTARNDSFLFFNLTGN